MTSLTYRTYAFIFVFLNVMHPSEEGCLDHLDDLKELNLSGNLTLTEDPENDCNQTKAATSVCLLLEDCFEEQKGKQMLPKCAVLPSQKVHFYHIMCLISNFVNNSEACNYRNVCNILPGIQCSVSNPTTTQTTTTTTTTTTATISPSEPTAPPLSHNTTLQDPNVSNRTTTQTTKTLPEMTAAAAPTTTAIISTSEPNVLQRHHNTTLQDPNVNLRKLLWLSLVFNVIVPFAVYLFMRHQWRRDKATYMFDGNSTENQQMIELDTSQAFVNSNSQTAKLPQVNEYEHESKNSSAPSR
ncbi:uncharacterized protein AB9W97_000006 isoform 2-T2 [Spinachia spinachia]